MSRSRDVLRVVARPHPNLLTAVLDSGPTHASAFTLNTDGTFSYTHDDSENFVDSFTYHVNDTANISGTVTVNITINPVNDNDPVGLADSATVDEGGTVTLLDSAGADLVPVIYDSTIKGRTAKKSAGLQHSVLASKPTSLLVDYLRRDDEFRQRTVQVTLQDSHDEVVRVARGDAFGITRRTEMVRSDGRYGATECPGPCRRKYRNPSLLPSVRGAHTSYRRPGLLPGGSACRSLIYKCKRTFIDNSIT